MDTYNPDLAIGKLRVLPRRAKPNGAASEPTEPLPYIDRSSWDANPAPEREWAVENRIPMYQPHLTTGHGAIGKSLLELTRAVAHVLGKPSWEAVAWNGSQAGAGYLSRRRRTKPTNSTAG